MEDESCGYIMKNDYAVKVYRNKDGTFTTTDPNQPRPVRIGFPDGTVAVYPDAKSLQDFLNKVWEYDRDRKLKILQKKLDKAREIYIRDIMQYINDLAYHITPEDCAKDFDKEIEDIKE